RCPEHGGPTGSTARQSSGDRQPSSLVSLALKSLSKDSRWPPDRRQAIWIVIVIALLVGAAGFVTSGVVAGLSLLLGFPGVPSLILIFLPTRPKIIVSLRGVENATTTDDGDGVVIKPQQAVRPIDIDQIVESEERAALKTMPRAPTPKVPPGAFGGVFDLNQSSANLIASMTGASDDELEAFMGKVQAFG